jgi:alcohol dehydrogenase, propanol-preferring
MPMRAMVLEQPAPIATNPLVPRDVPDPVPGPGELLLRVSVCGICHTDLHTVEGDLDLPRLPLVPGHQVVGRVVGLGEGATRFAIGDRVGMPWLRRTCGTCRFCRGGLENLCPDITFNGFHADGGYAELTTSPEAFAYALPDGFEDLQAAPLLCAGIIGYRALRLSGAGKGDRLGLYGFGASAHITIQVARHLGCRVSVFSRSSGHLDHARDLGAEWVGRSGDDPPEKLQAGIVFAPAGSVVLDGLRHLDRGGTLALAGVTMTPIPEIDYDDLLYQERILRSVTASTRRDAEELLRHAAEIPIRTDVEEIPLADANEALRRLSESRFRGAGVLRVT